METESETIDCPDCGGGGFWEAPGRTPDHGPCETCEGEGTVELDPEDVEKRDIARELLEGLTELLPLAQKLAGLDPAFRAYALADFEGTESGWLGMPDNFLIDRVRHLANP